MLCHNIHCDFAQIQVGADPGSGRDPNVILHIQNDSLRQLISCHSIGFQIMCHVHKHFINRIYMNIFRRHIFQIYIIAVSYTHLRAHETKSNLVCRLLLEKKKLVCRLLPEKKKKKNK